MTFSSFRWSESWRVLVYSAAAALAFVALERLELALFDAAGAERMLSLTRSKSADERLAAEAEDVSARSRGAAATLPAGHRLAAFGLGYEVGWASEFAGSLAMSDPSVQAKAAPIAEAHLALAREHARRIGIDVAGALPSRTLTDFVRLQERFESDESGLAGRVEAGLTPIHRHLFLLGAFVGMDAALVQGNRGELSGPQVEPIRRHATLAGVPPAAWQPLVADRRNEPATVVLDRHRVAVKDLLAAIAAGEVDARAATPR